MCNLFLLFLLNVALSKEHDIRLALQFIKGKNAKLKEDNGHQIYNDELIV